MLTSEHDGWYTSEHGSTDSFSMVKHFTVDTSRLGKFIVEDVKQAVDADGNPVLDRDNVPVWEVHTLYAGDAHNPVGQEIVRICADSKPELTVGDTIEFTGLEALVTVKGFHFKADGFTTASS